jgi:hypothetical protein
VTNFKKIIDKFIFENTTSILESYNINISDQDPTDQTPSDESGINEEEKIRMHKKMRENYEKHWREKGEKICKKKLSKQSPDLNVTQDTKYKDCVDDYIDTNKNDKKYCIWYDNCEKNMKGGENKLIQQSSLLKNITYNPENALELAVDQAEEQIMNKWILYNKIVQENYKPTFIRPLLKIVGRNTTTNPSLISLYTAITSGVSSSTPQQLRRYDYDKLIQDMNQYIKEGNDSVFDTKIDGFWTEFNRIINFEYSVRINTSDDEERLSIMNVLKELQLEAGKSDDSSKITTDIPARSVQEQEIGIITDVDGREPIYIGEEREKKIKTGWDSFKITFPCNIYWGEDTRNSITKTTGTALIKAIATTDVKNENWLYNLYQDVKFTRSSRRKMSMVLKLIEGFEKWIKTDFFDVFSSRLEWFRSSLSKDRAYLDYSLQAATTLAEKERLRREAELAKLPDGKSMTSEGKELVNWIVRLAAANGLTALGYVNDPRQPGNNDGNITEVCKTYVNEANGIIDFISGQNRNIFSADTGNPMPEFFNKLFSALCGIEIFILWNYAFTESNSNIGNISTTMPGTGQLDDRLLTSFIEIFKAINNSRISSNNIKQLGLISIDEDGSNGWNLDEIYKRYKSFAIPNGEGGSPKASERIVINNAASMLDQMTQSENVICTDSSIVDGMSQCSFDSAQGVRYGHDMNWITQDDEEKTFYSGIFKGMDEVRNRKGGGGAGTFKIAKLMIELYINNNKSDQESVGYRGSVSQDRHYFSNSNINLLTGKELEANYVYKNVLNELILIFQEYGTSSSDNSWIWENLSDPQNAGEFDRNRRFMNEILKKGAGDLFQEINSSLLAGGYDLSTSPYKNDGGKIPTFAKPGERSTWPFAVRIGMMGDRPSGARPVVWNMASNAGYITKSTTQGGQKEWNNPLFKNTLKGLTNVYNASGYYYSDGGDYKRSFFTINTSPYNFSSNRSSNVDFERTWRTYLINKCGYNSNQKVYKGLLSQFQSIDRLLGSLTGGGKRKTRKRKYRKSRRKSKKSKKKRKSRKKRRKTNKRK